MAKRSKNPADLNSLAASIVGQATDESAPSESPHADAGRRGGLKGGKVRAERL